MEREMSAVTIQQMADRVAGLMDERLRARGNGLSEKLRKAGRLMPRKVRVAAESLAQAALMAQNPKLLRQIDESLVADAYDICVRHLGAIPAGYRRKSTIIGVVSSIAFSLLAVAGLVAVVLYWRGFL